ncbi:thermonuclease family protein [Caenispirillum salinarum]|uniref:thermonuclease family protein n=1 Tax=Caenispirillum salinarum TaxID=859058 RepID=UPI0005BE0F74|nr:thermonuclease family protein [Caenispirillum salinarum]
MRSIAFAIAFVGAAVLSAPAYAEVTGRASVIDGDTLEIRGTRIRLHGIDAPESGQTCRSGGRAYRCGQHSANQLDKALEGRTVRCEGNETDRYGRLIGECFVEGANINAWMVRYGLAMAYRKYSRDYVGDEQAAKAEGRGIWATDFVAPWDWRRGKRLAEAQGGSAPEARSRSRGGAQGGDKDCGDFRTHAEAQAFFRSAGPGDPHRLDRDGDGRACESLP